MKLKVLPLRWHLFLLFEFYVIHSINIQINILDRQFIRGQVLILANFTQAKEKLSILYKGRNTTFGLLKCYYLQSCELREHIF